MRRVAALAAYRPEGMSAGVSTATRILMGDVSADANAEGGVSSSSSSSHAASSLLASGNNSNRNQAQPTYPSPPPPPTPPPPPHPLFSPLPAFITAPPPGDLYDESLSKEQTSPRCYCQRVRSSPALRP